MKDKEKGTGERSIRVVDDLPEEVVRLEGDSKRTRFKKSEGVSVELIEAKNLESGEGVKELLPFDPEKEWQEGEASEEQQAAPVGWFFLLGIVLLVVVGWAGSQAFRSSGSPFQKKASELTVDDTSSDEGPLGKLAEAEANVDAEVHFKATEDVLRNFLGAETVIERAKYVRHPKRVLPLMEDYYSRNEFRTFDFREITSYLSFPLEKLPFLTVEVRDDDGDARALLLEDGADGILVDWESYVCFQPVLLEEYVRERSTEPVTLRAYVTEDYFYSYEFDSQEEYASYRFRFQNSELLMNGYVKSGTELGQRFKKLFTEGGKKQWRPLIVKVRFLEGGQAKNSVLIEDLISTIWAFPRDPAEVASFEK